MDAVCVEGEWDAVVVGGEDYIKAVMPYYLVKGKLGHTYLTMPQLTQFMGPWLCYPEGQKYSRRLSYEKETMAELIAQLPAADSFYQNFHYSVCNWLPFYWNGYEQTTGYTYVLEDLTDLDAIFENFKGSIRREIRKAGKQVKIKIDNDIEKYYHAAVKTYERQQLSYPRPLEFLTRIDNACEAENSRRILFAEDSSGRVHAALYLIWDAVSAYHLMSGGDPELRTSGATSLLMWEAIRFAAGVTRGFDFEGSMIQPIERYFSSFGAVQKPYFQVSRTDSRFLKWKKFLK